jgi:hypothetical protein
MQRKESAMTTSNQDMLDKLIAARDAADKLVKDVQSPSNPFTPAKPFDADRPFEGGPNGVDDAVMASRLKLFKTLVGTMQDENLKGFRQQNDQPPANPKEA